MLPDPIRTAYIYAVPLDQLANLLDDAEVQKADVRSIHPDGSRWVVVTRGGIRGWVAQGRADHPAVDYTRAQGFPVEVKA